ncbi:MAG TPA: hypothetical protein V6D11_16835 [Waterburya sp.]|jgi:hypothetical protein
MTNESMLDLEKEQLNETMLDTINIKQFFESYLTSNSLEDEATEFFREVAALKGKSVDDTLLEMIAGTQKYLEAIDIDIEFKNDIPTDINQYVNKLKKISVGIESCWDIFSEESHQFFISLAQNFCRASSKFKGWKGVLIRLQLLLPSIKQKENLFKIYKESFFFIPRAVNRAIELRESKTTVQLKSTALSLLKRAREISTKQQTLSPFLKHLGRNQEEQIAKNQAAMAWAKARLEEIKSKRNGKDF